MVHVSNQRSEGKKWIPCFGGVTSIIFVLRLAGTTEQSVTIFYLFRLSFGNLAGTVDVDGGALHALSTPGGWSVRRSFCSSTKIEIFKSKLPKVIYHSPWPPCPH
jgi:hypothetical protein